MHGSRRRFLQMAAGAAALPAVSERSVVASLSVATGPLHRRLSRPAMHTNIIARLVGQWLTERLGQQFVIENRPGAASNIATEADARSAPPDGYTLQMIVFDERVQSDAFPGTLKFNFMRDIAPVERHRQRALSSSWSIHRCRSKTSRSSSPTPRPIRTRSTMPPAAMAARSQHLSGQTAQEDGWRRRWCTCPIAAPRRR